MSNRPNTRQRRKRADRAWRAVPIELAANGRILTANERHQAVAFTEASIAADPRMALCTCTKLEIGIEEPTAGTVTAPGRITWLSIGHDADCALAPKAKAT